MAVDSWPDGIRPQCHHSNSRKKYEDQTARVNAHSDWYYEPFDDCGFSVDVVLECKRKELAVFKYIKDFVNPKQEEAPNEKVPSYPQLQAGGVGNCPTGL